MFATMEKAAAVVVLFCLAVFGFVAAAGVFDAVARWLGFPGLR